MTYIQKWKTFEVVIKLFTEDLSRRLESVKSERNTNKLMQQEDKLKNLSIWTFFQEWYKQIILYYCNIELYF